MTDFEHDPNPLDFEGWRFFYVADGERLIAPFRPSAELNTEAVCQEFDHPAPQLNCSCGIWVAKEPSSLLTVALAARDFPRLPAIVAAATEAEARGEEYRIPTPVLAHVRAYDSLPATGQDQLKKSRVVWSLVGQRQDHHGWHPELGVFRRAARIELLDLHIGAHDLTDDEFAGIEARYNVTMTEYIKPATTTVFKAKIGPREIPLGSPERPFSDYEVVRQFVPAGDPVARQMREFGLLP